MPMVQSDMERLDGGRWPLRVRRVVMAPLIVLMLLGASLVAAPETQAQEADSGELTLDPELRALWEQFKAEQEPGNGASGLPGDITTGDLQIINGTNIGDGEFPFLVAVVLLLPPPDLPVLQCTGVLITPRVVLTAAHCTADIGDLPVKIGLGSRNWTTPVQVLDAPRTYEHPEYLGERMNDIAVLVLDGEADISHPNIGLIPYGPALPSGEGADEITVIGWGDTDPTANGRAFPDIARKVDLSLRECNLDLGPGSDENDWNHLCSYETNRDSACHGDSGGPAVQTINGRLTLVALVQGGPDDGTCGIRPYGIFQRVAPHTLWIKRPSQMPTKCLGEWVTIDMNTNGGNGNGTYGNDVILGTNAADKIFGGGGHDNICGLAGNDRIFGGAGSDFIQGGTGNDIIHGNRGNDLLDGYDGDDKIFGYAGHDLIVGGDGLDRLHGNFGNDFLRGENGNDSLFGYGDNDRLEGGAGADLMVGNFGADHLYGQGGDDSIYGSDGADIVSGGQGNDLIEGNSGPDTLFGGAGNDTIDGGIGSDQCDGNHGTDSATRCESVRGIP